MRTLLVRSHDSIDGGLPAEMCPVRAGPAPRSESSPCDTLPSERLPSPDPATLACRPAKIRRRVALHSLARVAGVAERIPMGLRTGAQAAALLGLLAATARAQVTQPRNVESLKNQQPCLVEVVRDGDLMNVQELFRAWDDGALTWSNGVSTWKQGDSKDVNVVGLQGFTALHMAAHNGHVEIAKLLLTRGANPRQQKGLNKAGFVNEAGWSPLHWAAKNNHGEMVELLIEAGASIDAEASAAFHFGTPLHIAAGAEERADALEALLKAGADVDLRDDEGNSPLHFAVSRSAVRVTQLLLRYGADPLASNAQRQTPLTMAAATRADTVAPVLPKPTGGEALGVELVFEDEGSLGIAFAQFGDDKPAEIESLKPGGLAATHAQGDKLKPGMVLTAVQGKPVANFKQGIGAIQKASRPLSLRFAASERELQKAAAAAKEEAILLDQNEAAAKAAADEGASLMEQTIAEEQKTAFGQWLQKRQMRSYAKAFMLVTHACVTQSPPLRIAHYLSHVAKPTAYDCKA